MLYMYVCVVYGQLWRAYRILHQIDANTKYSHTQLCSRTWKPHSSKKLSVAVPHITRATALTNVLLAHASPRIQFSRSLRWRLQLQVIRFFIIHCCWFASFLILTNFFHYFSACWFGCDGATKAHACSYLFCAYRNCLKYLLSCLLPARLGLIVEICVGPAAPHSSATNPTYLYDIICMYVCTFWLVLITISAPHSSSSRYSQQKPSFQAATVNRCSWRL